MPLSWRLAAGWRLAGVIAAAATVTYAQTLVVRAEGGGLRVSAPKLHFLTGTPLERVRNGASVIFAIQLTLFTDRKAAALHRTGGRFAVSYDLWEEKFAVTRLGNPRRSISHLAAAAAEAWCLENLVIATPGLSRTSPFWIRLEVRAKDAESEVSSEEEPGISLARLVEFFSRAPREEEPRWQAEGGPFRLADLR